MLLLALFATICFFIWSAKNIEAHDPMLLLNKTGKLVVACIGDSLMSSRYLTGSSLPTLLQHKLGANRFTVRNFGSDGACISDTNNTKNFKYKREYGRAKAASPNIVVMMFGTTDAKPTWNYNETETRKTFKREYTYLIEEYQSLKTRPTVFICMPPPVYCSNCSSANVNKLIIHEMFPSLITEIAHRTGAITVNIFEALGGRHLSKPLFFFDKADPRTWKEKFPQDGVHPNSKGSLQMAVTLSTRIHDYINQMNKTLRAFGGKFGSATAPGHHTHTHITAHHGTRQQRKSRNGTMTTGGGGGGGGIMRSRSNSSTAVTANGGMRNSANYTNLVRGINSTGSSSGGGVPIRNITVVVPMRKTILCVGDSITAGGDDDGSSSFSTSFSSSFSSSSSSSSSSMSYPAILQRMPSFQNHFVRNHGLSNTCVSSRSCGEKRAYKNSEKYRAAIMASTPPSSLPHAVILQFGGIADAESSSWDEAAFYADYKDLVLSFTNLTSHPLVFICTPPPIYNYNSNSNNGTLLRKHNTEETTKALQTIINTKIARRIIPKIARDTGTIAIDVFEALGGLNLTRPNTVNYNHGLTDLGNLAMAHEVAEVVHSYLRSHGGGGGGHGRGAGAGKGRHGRSGSNVAAAAGNADITASAAAGGSGGGSSTSLGSIAGGKRGGGGGVPIQTSFEPA